MSILAIIQIQIVYKLIYKNRIKFWMNNKNYKSINSIKNIVVKLILNIEINRD